MNLFLGSTNKRTCVISDGEMDELKKRGLLISTGTSGGDEEKLAGVDMVLVILME